MSLTFTFPYPSNPKEFEEIPLTIGLPTSSLPRIIIDQIETNPQLPYTKKSLKYNPPDRPVYWVSLERFRDLNIGILKFSPIIKENQSYTFVNSIKITIPFQQIKRYSVKIGKAENSLYRNRILNWNVAKNWVLKPTQLKRKTGKIFPDGQWYKISIQTDGLYKLTYDILSSSGINVDEVNPKSLQIYTNPSGGRPLDTTVGIDIPENLVEVAITVIGESDTSFDSEDEILFYGRGPRGFDPENSQEISFTQNPYTNVNYYWLFIPTNPKIYGSRIEKKDESSFDNPIHLDYGFDFVHHENDLENPYKMGLFWVGAGITRNQTISIAFNLHHPKKDVDATLRTSLFGGTTSTTETNPHHKLNIYQKSVNDIILVTQSWNNISSQEFNKGLEESILTDGPNFIVFQNASSDEISKIFIDWATLQYGRELIWENTPIEFWAPPNVSIGEFEIENGNNEIKIWNISDFLHPVEYPIEMSGTLVSFKTALSNTQLSHFIIFTTKSVPVPPSIEFQPGQTFSSLRREIYPIDHIIISPSEFLTVANRLKEHRTKSIVAPLQTIYDEFSGGVVDPVALRYFLKWTKENWRTPSTGSFPSYVLLFGDGDYDYRNITGNSQMRIPTFSSNIENQSSSDDRFTFFDGNTPEMAIGRFPAVTLDDAENMVDKTIAYEENPEMGLWRKRVTLIADDFKRPFLTNIELSHTKNSELIFSKIPRSIDVQKIYMEDFPAVNDGSQYGVKKPDATEALFHILENGTVLLNYIGHGSPYQWAQEALLSSTRGDLTNINTGMKLPVWIAATCSWGHYDLVEGSAMSEELLRLRDNGAIAIISTNDVITFSANESFILKLFSSFFPDGKVTSDPIGAVFQSIKTTDVGSRLFHLFGDPALKLALPYNSASIDTILPDTLKALQTGSFSGETSDVNNLQGEGYVILYDADREIILTYIQKTHTEYVPYILPGRPLFRGFIDFTHSQYEGNFIIPKDINSSTLNGRMTVYLYGNSENNLWEGLGVREGLILSGSLTNPLDEEGPIINFIQNNRTLQWGDHINENEKVMIRFSDPLGINITGEVGHAIRLWIGEDESDAMDLTHLFVYDTHSYTTGTIPVFPSDLPLGETMITVEAWDNANNPSKKSITLNITSKTKLELRNVFNYPNPFSKKTQFGFEVTQEAYVTIKIFTLSGQLITVLDPMDSFFGYAHIDWNGRDDFNDRIANGVYLYQITATSIENRKKVTKIGKLAKYQ